MKDKPLAVWVIGLVMGALIVAGFAGGRPVQAATTTVCGPLTGAGAPVKCVNMPTTSLARVGMQITTGKGTGTATQFLILDPNKAPMAWNNLFGWYTGGDGGAMPGGLICVTYGVSSCAAALTPTGTLVLQATGPDGPTGPPVALTADQLTRLLALIGATPAHPRLKVVGP